VHGGELKTDVEGQGDKLETLALRRLLFNISLSGELFDISQSGELFNNILSRELFSFSLSGVGGVLC